MSVVLETTIGDITVDLYLKERPNACLNFLKLCRIKYYNLCIFHKVERNFIAQTGDPTSTGRGGESVFCHLYGEQAKYFDAELKPRLKHEKLGTISMVNNGNNMNGSQFFITLGENITYLDEVHTVFGEVAEGFDVLLKINEAICDPNNNRPYQDIRITHTVILHDPFEDPPALEIPDSSPIPTREQLESNYIGADEEIDDTEGKTAEQIEEKIKESEAKARATILEMVGDIPDADIKPPENVLFVCKLNPVTTSEDLEIIFSRFGPIVSCEVIKDKTSGESLQYAFIEFEKEENCENAYFKMANCLIDDRRIHVDFSQSVSKLNWNSRNNYPKQNYGRFQNFLIKDREKKSDGYDMIFDMEERDKARDRKSENRNRSPAHRQKRHSPEHHYDRRHTTFPSKEKYKQSDKYFENDRTSYKKTTYQSGSSKSDRGYKEEELSSKERSRSRISRSPSVKLGAKEKLKHASYLIDTEKKSNNKSHKKKKRHDSSSSDHSTSPEGNKLQKYPILSSHHNSKKKVSLERSKHDSYSHSYSKFSQREYSKQKHRSRSQSSDRSEIKKKRETRKSPSYRQSRSVSPEHSKRKISKQAYRKSPSASPESLNRMKKASKSSYLSQSRSECSGNKRKTSEQRSSSPELSSQKKNKRSLSRSPETSKRKRKDLKQKPRKRSKSSSSESTEISYQRMKATKERHAYTKYKSRSPEPIRHKQKYSDKASSSRSRSPQSPKRNEIALKHISCQPRSPSKSPELSKKWTSNHKSNHKSCDQPKFQLHDRLNSKSSKSRNLSKYDSTPDSDQQSKHKSSKAYVSSKKKSHKHHKRSSS